MNYNDIIHFWFVETDPSLHFASSESFDRTINERFGNVWKQAIACELYEWRKAPQGRLAEIIVLDQFSRNIFRNTPQAFSADSLALVLAQEAVSLGVLYKLPTNQQPFLCMPFMHSESKKVHIESEKLFKKIGNNNAYNYELKHKAIIDRFGRYPHRNAILHRESTAKEVRFLQEPDSSF